MYEVFHLNPPCSEVKEVYCWAAAGFLLSTYLWFCYVKAGEIALRPPPSPPQGCRGTLALWCDCAHILHE